MSDCLTLNNLAAKMDWVHAKDYILAMWFMFQQDEPDDYVICLEEAYSVREFCGKAFSHVCLDYKDYVVTNQETFRVAKVDVLLRDCSKANEKSNWAPKVSFRDFVAEMVDSDLKIFGGAKK